MDDNFPVYTGPPYLAHWLIWYTRQVYQLAVSKTIDHFFRDIPVEEQAQFFAEMMKASINKPAFLKSLMLNLGAMEQKLDSSDSQ